MWGVIAIAIATILSVALVAIFREGDNTAVITAIIGLAVPTIASILAYMKTQETHAIVNSKLDEVVKTATAAARAEGVEEGRDEANLRTDKLQKSNKSKQNG